MRWQLIGDSLVIDLRVAADRLQGGFKGAPCVYLS